MISATKTNDYHLFSVTNFVSIRYNYLKVMASAERTESVNSSESSYDVIQKVKDVYGQQCRVITDIGEFAYVINVKLYESILSIKFQLTSKYRLLYK